MAEKSFVVRATAAFSFAGRVLLVLLRPTSILIIVLSFSLLKSCFWCQATSRFITVSFSSYTDNTIAEDVRVMSHLLSCTFVQGHLLHLLIISEQ